MRNNWVKSLIINAIILIVVLVFVQMSYETNDDYAIASRILAGSPHVEFTDYFLCLFLSMVQERIPFINVFILFQGFVSFLALMSITKLALDLDRSVWIKAVAVAIVALYSLDHYGMIQFTKTSGLLAAAAVLLIVDSVVHKRNAFYYAIGIFFMFLSTMLRFEMCVFPICFGGLYLLMRIIHGRKNIVSEGYLSPGRLVGYALVLVLLGCAAGVHFLSDAENLKTKELKDYIYYSTYRSYVVDYPIYEHFCEHPEEYSGIDITKNDFSLIDNWYFDYNGAASAENLTKIKEVYDHSETASGISYKSAARSCAKHIIKAMKKPTAEGIQIWILLLLALGGLIRMKPKYWWYIVALGAGALAFYLLLYEMGRPAYRVIYIINLSATVFLLHAMERSAFWEGPDAQEHRGIHIFGRVLGAMGCAIMILALCGGIWLRYDQCQSHAASIEKHLRPAALAERIAGDQRYMYVFSTREKCNTYAYARPLRPPDKDKNVVTFGGWGTCSPYLMDRLAAYDLTNVFGDIIDNDKVYVIEDKRAESLEEYFNRWYGDREGLKGKIRLEPVDQVDGYQIWRVTSAPAKNKKKEKQ